MKTTSHRLYRLLPVVLLTIAICAGGCATASQRARGMDNNDARREAFWVGVVHGVGHLLFGDDEAEKVQDPAETKPAETP